MCPVADSNHVQSQTLPTSPGGEPAKGARTFRVNRYELGYDVPIAQQVVAVDIRPSVVDVRDATHRWTVRDGRVYRSPLSRGARERVDEPPAWLSGVLAHVGLHVSEVR